MKTITLRNYNSRFYPVEARWNRGRNSAVFETVEAAKDAMIGRFGACRFIDHTSIKKDVGMIQRWHKAIARTGGTAELLNLPEQVKDVLKSTNDLTAKTLMLEAIADEMTGRKA